MHARVLALALAWGEADRQHYLRERWRQVAWAARYGKAGIFGLLLDGEQLSSFCNAVGELMEDEARASRR